MDWTAIIEALVPILMLVISAGVAAGAAALRKKTGIDITKAHQDSLHKAIETGINRMLAEHRGAWGDGSVPSAEMFVKDQAMRDGVKAYIQKSVPDAVDHLGRAALRGASPLPDVIDDLIIGKAGDLLSRATRR